MTQLPPLHRNLKTFAGFCEKALQKASWIPSTIQISKSSTKLENDRLSFTIHKFYFCFELRTLFVQQYVQKI